MIGGGAILSDFIEKQIGYQIKAISEGLNDSARQCLNMLEKIENCQQSYKEVLAGGKGVRGTVKTSAASVSDEWGDDGISDQNGSGRTGGSLGSLVGASGGI